MSRQFWRELCEHDVQLPRWLEAVLAPAVLTNGAEALLTHALCINELKMSSKNVFSSTPLLIAAVDLGFKYGQARRYPKESADPTDFRDLQPMLAAARVALRLGEARSTPFGVFAREFVGGAWQLGTSLNKAVPAVSLDLSEGIGRAFRQLVGNSSLAGASISAERLLLAILPSSTRLPRRLMEIELTVEDFQAAIQAPADPTAAGAASPDTTTPVRAEFSIPAGSVAVRDTAMTEGSTGNGAAAADTAAASPTSSEIEDSPFAGGSDAAQAERATEPDGPASAERMTEFGRLPPNIERNARREEQALNARQYAIALAVLLRMSVGELCIGLFGHWGLGKTYLAQMIGALLTDRQGPEEPRLADALQDVGVRIDLAPSDAFGRKYEIVNFSAWRYRRTPELWVYLYETLSGACMAKDRFARLLRYNVLRQGHWALSLTLIATGAALASVSALKVAIFGLMWLLPIIGAGGLLWLIQTYFATRKGTAAIMRRYTSLSNYNDKLGMQALLGNELHSLIMAWAPQNKLRLWELWRELIALPVVGGAWYFGQYFLPTLTADFRTASCSLLRLLPTGFPACGDAVVEAGASWHAVAAGLIWLGLWLGTIVLLLVHRSRTDRILLIVDDLDRCSAEEMIEVMESLKLLLEDRDIQERVQVLMLIDEGVLEYAVGHKFEGLIKARAERREGDSALADSRREVIREHLEKLFLCHFRLPPLSALEVRTLTARYAVEVAQPQQAASLKDEPKSSPDGNASPAREVSWPAPDQVVPSPDDVPGTGWSIPPPPGASPADSFPPEEREVDLFFTQTEAEDLAIAVAAQADKAGHMISPRAIRAFLLKYQLARLLRQLARQRVEGKQLISALAEASFGSAAHRTADRRDGNRRYDISVIVEQLA